MSKRAQRKARRQEKLRRDIRNAVIVAAVGLALLAAGCFGLIQNNRRLREYQDSQAVITVPAEITRSDIRTEKDLDGSPYDVWDVQLKYTAEGREYTGQKRLYESAGVGDTRNVEVYRTASGEYRLAEIRSGETLLVNNLAPIAGTVVGGLLAIIGAFMAISGKRELNQTKPRT